MDNIYLTILYDYYSGLLSDKQKNYFELYYFSNLTLQEISEKLNVSRNAVHKQLKKVGELLIKFEELLHLYNKDKKLEEIIKEIKDAKLKKKLLELLK